MTKKRNTDAVTECIGCGGTLHFDVETCALKCESCEEITKFIVEPMTSKILINDFEKFKKQPETVQQEMKCTNCGAVESISSRRLSVTCPFCGSNDVTFSENTAAKVPDAIIPFKISQKQIQKNFSGWIKRKLFAPTVFKKLAKVNNFKSVYTPCFLFDTDVYSNYSGTLQRSTTESYVDRDGVSRTRTSYENFSVKGQRKDVFDNELIPAGQRITFQTINALKPFNYGELKLFNPNYLLGIFANSYSYSIRECFDMAKMVFREVIKRRIINYHHADRAVNLNIDSSYYDEKYLFVLIPVWVGNYTYKSKVYNFYVNGQTGEVSGKSPVSAIKIILFILSILLVLGLVILLLVK